MTQTKEKKQRRPFRGLLVASLALNLLIVGVVGGAIVSHGGGHDGGKPSAKDRFVTPYVQALSRQDRMAVGRAIRQSYQSGDHALMGERSLYFDTVDVLRAEVFDAQALNNTLLEIDVSAEGRRDVARRHFVERISQMTPEERLIYADRLEEILDRRDKHKSDKPRKDKKDR
ncbi:periplasmic heavy metal sensor [Shimia haliotis]|uniref:Uncharacterized membrane protein n=1 Tax=Shimia haliotis TaxID=1280847 RepID=A0A1I3ZWG5_9RHOB|nr:periplasmic heavy metal sensor [Shimia haliotis]SFK48247.1 Uncharacterized membrane protein [Shimia haliotis]